MAIQDLFCNTVTVISRQEVTEYVDWISKKTYKQSQKPIKCRISNLNYKDLQLIGGIDDVKVKIQKLFTLPDVNIKPTDYVLFGNSRYQVITMYKAQDDKGVHHNKYFIKCVD